LLGKPKRKKPLGRPRLRRGEIILSSNSRKSVWEVVCIDLAQGRDWWNALVQVAMELPVLKNGAKLFTSIEIVPSQEFLCHMELFNV
jgi:hypothetical protein